MQGVDLALASAAEDDPGCPRPKRRDVEAKRVRIVAVRVEAKAPAHGRDRSLPANHQIVVVDDDLDARPSIILGWGSVSTPEPNEYQPQSSGQTSGCSGKSVRTASSGRPRRVRTSAFCDPHRRAARVEPAGIRANEARDLAARRREGS